MNRDIASLVGSRICHDLISPIGAISNGVELMGMTQGTDGAEMALINDSVHNASARLRFFRLAFGKASPEQLIGHNEVTQILGAMAKGGRIGYDWLVPDKQSRTNVRAAFLLLQCFETAFPRGGHIGVSVTEKGWRFHGTGAEARWDPELWDSLSNQFSRVVHTPAQVQFALLPEALEDANWCST
ncbi:MAG: histidine phosphotransferase family protein [Pseudomonadota bacterium]